LDLGAIFAFFKTKFVNRSHQFLFFKIKISRHESRFTTIDEIGHIYECDHLAAYFIAAKDQIEEGDFEKRNIGSAGNFLNKGTQSWL